MNDTPRVNFLHLSGYDVFAIPATEDPRAERVFGHQHYAPENVDVFPASLPLADLVLHDLEVVYGEVTFTDAAQRWLEELERKRAAIASEELPEDLTFVYPPYQHQRRGIARAIHCARYGLWYDMGLGKSKIATDALRALFHAGDIERALVIVPPFLVGVWLHELKKHSFEGELRVQGLSTREGSALDVATRDNIYTGTPHDVRSQTKYSEAFPDVVYAPVDEGLPDEMYVAERAYLEAFVADDRAARDRARAKMRRVAKRAGYALPRNTPRWYKPTDYLYAEDANVLVMSYDVMSADMEKLRKLVDYDMLIFDEVHYLRSENSNRSKAARKLATKAPRILALSGTPMLGNPWHKYTWLYLMHPNFAKNRFKYAQRFTRQRHIAGTNRRMELGYKNLDLLAELDATLADTVRTQDCVDLDLPALNIVDVPYSVPYELRKAYNEIVLSWETDPGVYDAEVVVQQGMDRINKLLQILSGFLLPSREHFTQKCEACPHILRCAEVNIIPHTSGCLVYPDPPEEPLEVHRYDAQPKLDVLTEYLLSITSVDENKVIVWCSYNEEVRMVADRLDALGIEYVEVTGSTPDKVSRQDRFNEDDDCKVYVSNIAICEGFTLNVANYTIYYGLGYNQAHYLQSLKRNHRIGQGRPVTVYRLYAEGTVHEYIMRALEQKEKINDVVAGVATCTGCEHREACLAAGTAFMSEDCVYSTSPDRVITRPKLLV